MAVDLLASEYGWEKRYILEELYFDEYIDLALEIKDRKKREYKTQLAIASNPHFEADDQKKLWEAFEEENNYVPDYALDPNAALDKTDFARLKMAMADNPRIIIQSE